MSDATATRNEECRHAALTYLAERPACAFNPDSVTRSVNRAGGDWSFSEVRNALELLAGLGLVRVQVDALGSTRYYQITAAGTLQHERGRG